MFCVFFFFILEFQIRRYPQYLITLRGGCYGLNDCVPPNSYVETLTSNLMVLEGEALGR